MSSFNNSYLSFENGAYSFRRRNPRFSWEELQILAQETSKNFELLRQKETDEAVKQMKQRVWNGITEKVNAVNRSNSRREPLQLKRKWIEARSRVRHKLIASHRRRAGSGSDLALPGAASNGDCARPAASAAATPVELSYFEKLLTLSMSEELQDEEMRQASHHRQLKQLQKQQPARQRCLKPARDDEEMPEEEEEEGAEGEDADYEEGPSCLTMTPEEMSHEGQQADVEMWTVNSNNGDDDVDLLPSSTVSGRRRAVGSSRFDAPARLKVDVADEVFALAGADGLAHETPPLPLPPPPPQGAQSRACLLCGAGPSAAAERMLAERHALKLNILHNKAHYWYAKCRQVAPEVAVPPPAVPGLSPRPGPGRSRPHGLDPALAVKAELYDAHMSN